MDRPVVVIGAGAAGIIAAWRVASLGAKVVLLEKTPRIGTKILISGGGKCNITHDGPIESVLRAFRPNEARFIRPACYRFTNEEIVEMLTSRGLEVYTRPDGRIFPTHGTAKDVVAILRYLDEVGVDLRLNTPVRRLRFADATQQGAGRQRECVGVDIDAGAIEPSAVVVAVGGSSYPNSGTTGDGWAWARAAGHTIVPVLAALAPIHLADPIEDWAGVALRDCVLKARLAPRHSSLNEGTEKGKVIAKWRGDLLFTHRGVSGPTVLGVSREVSEAMTPALHPDGMGGCAVRLEADLVPDSAFETLGEAIVAWTKSNPRKGIATYLEDILPKRLVEHTLATAGVPESRVGAQLSAKERNRLIEILKAWPVGAVREVDLAKGEVVAGGVSLDEIDPHTMRSAFVSNLFLCGEVLDIAGPVGGYNLQAAFATGFVAGESAAATRTE